MENSSEIRRAFFDALKINPSLINFELDGEFEDEPAEEEEYYKECLLENSTITSMWVHWDFAELGGILARNGKMAEEKRFKITKLAAQSH